MMEITMLNPYILHWTAIWFPVKVYQNPTNVIFGEMTTLHIKIIWLVFSYNLTVIQILSGDLKITSIIFLKKKCLIVF